MKDQRLTFIITTGADGKLRVRLDFHPKLSGNEEAFRKLPFQWQIMQAMATKIAKWVAEGMAKDGIQKN